MKEVISSGNTTIISDYIGTCFPLHDRKWLVQAKGTATIQSVIQQIQQGSITVDRHYIFLLIGHNQLQAVKKASISTIYKTLIKLIRSKNLEAKIFVSALLPRPVDNQQAKPLIVKFNRIIATLVNNVRKITLCGLRWFKLNVSKCQVVKKMSNVK